MFEDVKNESVNEAVDSANNFVTATDNGPEDNNGKKKALIIIISVLVLAILIFAFWYLFGALKHKANNNNVLPNDQIISEEEKTRLNNVHLDGSEDMTGDIEATVDHREIEYLSFVDFYKLPEDNIEKISFKEFELPINIKVDAVNYYDLSRKLVIDEGLASLNNQAFALIDNPWEKDAPSFYEIANKLNEEKIPLYLSADFIAYYYQSILKQAFKDIEEGVFYESLWNTSYNLYEQAKTRYEANLIAIGNVNDRILEGERLETAFFAISLELLKPQITQVDVDNKFNAGRFSPQDQRTFSFSVPDYLTDDVSRELKLIREAKEVVKSPVLLYDRDYKNFIVPLEYSDNARLQNFYLAAAWLKSVFPLNYRDDNCQECLLDYDDWRINFTAAALISQDFSTNQKLKNEWASVYKTIAFFKGLRSGWDYVDYRDNLSNLFGENYNIVTIFAEDNIDGNANMEKLRQSLLNKVVVPMQGALNLKTMSGYTKAGLQFLADFYWPNEFIFDSLSYPEVGLYLSESQPAKNNVTACSVFKNYQRCQGSSQDVLSLIYPNWRGVDFLENANYANYFEALNNLRPLSDLAMNNNLNNYWSSLLLWRSYLNSSRDNLPSYFRSEAWYEREVMAAAGAWVDMQLPLDKLSLKIKADQSNNLSVSTNILDDHAWLEPNINYFDRLLAYNNMILGTFEALGINERSSLAVNRLRNAGIQIAGLREISLKQAQGIDLDGDDNQFIRDFALMYTIDEPGLKTLSWQNDKFGIKLKETLRNPRLIVVAHALDNKIVLAVGPVFSYQESK
ncbi:DUF3160 domain-containing protein [Patescibacteria group bacterium]|nr:DUF3160 domain-containing protein [Patescibacteria group bacterium]